MTILAVVSQKGGVGKTTTVVSIGSLLATDHGNTLMIDLDPHGSLSSYFGNDPDRNGSGSAQLFESVLSGTKPHLDPLVQPTAVDNLYLVPASTRLATMERRGARIPGLGLVLRQSLAGASKNFDHILIDTPPILGMLMINALAACERIVIPVQTDYLAIRGLDLVERTLERVRSSRGWELPSIVVPTFYDRRTKAAIKGLEELQRRYTDNLWQDVIPVDSGIRNASSEGIPYPLYNRRGRAAQAYSRLVNDLLALPRTSREAPGAAAKESTHA
jgi:chromosome partitioning protein